MWNTRLEKGQGSGGGRTCFKCGKTGHTTRNYPQANIEIWGGGAAVTRSKDVWNHKTDSSTYNGGGFSRVNKADEGCYNCREPGHFSRECPKLGLGGRTNGFSSRGFGSNENGWADQNGESKRPREKYIPPEILDETLFEHGISTGINFSKYDEIQCTVSGHKPPEPLENFEDVGLRSLVADNIKRSNYRDMTPVQRYALPIILKGRDMMACAQTGSGKTAAFLIPIVHTLLEVGIEPHMGHPQKPEAIIVTPTRELAIQITKEAKKFSFNSNIGCYCIYGGADVGHQSHELREKNINILVATPGRLLHFVRNDYLSFERVKYFVLDEADRMLDLGFMGDVEEIVRNPNMPGKRERQTLMFSATFPEEIQRAAATFLDDDYLFLKVGEIGGANTDVTQKIIQVDAFDKRPQLVSLLKDSLKSPKVTAKTLIFVEMKKTADFLAAYLSQDEYNSTSIHGDRTQRQREEAVKDFEKGRRTILVATGVAARGLDIPGVDHVVNYDLPNSIDEYVHRIGRTGRVGNTGRATSFYDDKCVNDQMLARGLVKILSQAQQVVPGWLKREADRAPGGNGISSAFGAFGNFNNNNNNNNNVNSDIRQNIFSKSSMMNETNLSDENLDDWD